jgi:hypothetical protein
VAGPACDDMAHSKVNTPTWTLAERALRIAYRGRVPAAGKTIYLVSERQKIYLENRQST